MIIIQPSLLNFTAFQNLGLFGSTVRISQTGIVHDSREICEDCRALCCYNGSSNKGKHELSKSTDSFLRKGQQLCMICQKTIQIENDWLDSMLEKINQFIKCQIISLSD